MEKYEKPIAVQMSGKITPIAPLYPVAGAIGFIAGLASGDSHGVGGRNVEHLEENIKGNGAR